MTAAPARRPSLRLILLAVNLVILAIPISGLYLFRIYENELVRQTESELIAQGALAAAMFRREVVALAGPDYGLLLWSSALARDDDSSKLRITPPRLEYSPSAVLPRALALTPSNREPDPTALAAAEALAPTLREAGLTTLSTVDFLDFHGLAVGDRRGQGLSLARNEEVAHALEGRYWSVLRAREVEQPTSLSSASRDTPYRVFAAFPVLNGRRLAGVVHLSRTPRELKRALYQERANLIQAGTVVLALMVLVSLTASLLIIAPVKRLAREARRVADDQAPDLSRKSAGALVVVREVAELNESVAAMSERLKRRSDYLKIFASGVSHEVKTPLTAIKGALELLGEHGQDMDGGVFRKFQNNIRLDLERLERLVGRLLALARAEAVSPTGDEKTDASELAAELAERTMAAHPGFRVSLAPQPPRLEAAVAREVLETVLVNLFDNSRENGAGQIRLTLTRSGDWAHILVEDDGPGLTAEEAEKIFQPFYTTRKHQGGTGLGLSLARTILGPYQGRLEWVGPPAIFRVAVPLVKA
ncbi:MAG: HAMP domain-containing histidine kinase [Deltaproteobacteria bacterium]|jgi:signal transduction histidine kinase|nr:HAMP domain-containing histidine kinase [Deltaproteobacteria bacterium]